MAPVKRSRGVAQDDDDEILDVRTARSSLVSGQAVRPTESPLFIQYCRQLISRRRREHVYPEATETLPDLPQAQTPKQTKMKIEAPPR
jgi:hypothetical protein